LLDKVRLDRGFYMAEYTRNAKKRFTIPFEDNFSSNNIL